MSAIATAQRATVIGAANPPPSASKRSARLPISTDGYLPTHSDDIDNTYDVDHIDDIDRIDHIDTDHIDRSGVDSTARAYEEELLARRAALSHQSSSGAGAILFSALVYRGWRLPPFLLVDTDEKHLFELEVKVKLSHVSCGAALMDALGDFPPHALIGRAGLVRAMLDVLGAPMGATAEEMGTLVLVGWWWVGWWWWGGGMGCW